MDAAQFLFILIGISVPIGAYFWRESRYRNPAFRWRQIAPALEMRFAPNPPRLSGHWKGREALVCAQEDGTAIVSMPFSCPGALRLEIGPRAEVERDAGIIVPDRVRFQGPEGAEFERRYMVRANPLEMGETALDISLRQRILAMNELRLVAASDRIDMAIPLPCEVRELRDALDILSSLADALDGI